MEYTKVCFKCEIEQPITEFYKHSQMKEGHFNKCKTCTRKDTREREEILRSNPEWVEKEKKRNREKYHRLGYKDIHKPNPKKKKTIIENYKNKYPEKYLAKNKSQRLPCKKGNQLHHWSYNEEHYKDVIELSVSDHYLLHRYIIYVQEIKLYKNKLNGNILKTKESHLELLEKIKLWKNH